MKFYPRKWAHYELAVPGTLKLLPPEYRWDHLQKDYASMRNMMLQLRFQCFQFAAGLAHFLIGGVNGGF